MPSNEFLLELQTRQDLVNDFIAGCIKNWNPPQPKVALKKQLKEAMAYSLNGNGKRFRPVLCLIIAEAFAVAPQKILPWALAIEMIHTYSLIHDDLPTMDNDDFRRGEPTNHKVFGDTLALLAGDTLQTEAFHFLSQAYPEEPHKNLELIRVLAEASGLYGMALGQAMDLTMGENPEIEDLSLMHSLKTGALIRACAEGVAVLCGLPERKRKLVKEFGACLGLAFQLKDDILDSEQAIEPMSFPGILGLEKTRTELQRVSEKAKSLLAELDIQKGLLVSLVEYNQSRTH